MSHYDLLAFFARNPDWPIVFFAGCVWGIVSLFITVWLGIAFIVSLVDSFESYIN